MGSMGHLIFGIALAIFLGLISGWLDFPWF